MPEWKDGQRKMKKREFLFRERSRERDEKMSVAKRECGPESLPEERERERERESVRASLREFKIKVARS